MRAGLASCVQAFAYEPAPFPHAHAVLPRDLLALQDGYFVFPHEARRQLQPPYRRQSAPHHGICRRRVQLIYN